MHAPDQCARKIGYQELDGSLDWPSIAVFSSGPGAKRGTRLAAITIECPLRGFRTCRAFRWLTPKVPKPESVTRFPLARLVWMFSRNASSARVACALVRLASTAILPTRSLLFTRHVRCRDFYQTRLPVSIAPSKSFGSE